MLDKIDITAKGFHLSGVEKEHIMLKVGSLGQYAPRHALKSAHAEVIVKRGSVKGMIAYMSEIVLHLPKSVLASQAAATSVEESVDAAEAKLKAQVLKYKSKRASISSIRHKIFRRRKSKAITTTEQV
jgi:ribosome-associated translation inhibitor RaiA